MNAVNATALFELAEASVPVRSQVFAAVLELLEATLASAVPKGATQQLYIILALYALQLALILGSVGLRFWAGDRWLFRVVRCRFGTYIAPNFGLLWQLLIAVFIVAVEVLLWLLIKDDPTPPPGYYFGVVGVWLAFWFAALSAVWAIAVSACEIGSRSNSAPSFWQRPVVVHAIFIGYPAIELVSTCVMGGLVNRAFSLELDAVLSTISSLAVAAFEAKSMSAAQLDSQIKLSIGSSQNLFDRIANFYRLFRISGCVNLAHCVVVWILYLAISVPYLVRLRRQLLQPVQGSNYKELRISLYTAAATCTALSIATLGFAGIQAWQIYLASSDISAIGQIVQSSFAFHWLFVSLGLPLCACALWRSIALRRTKVANDAAATTCSESGVRTRPQAMEAPKRSMSFPVSLSPRVKDQNRFEVTMEQVTQVDGEKGKVMRSEEEFVSFEED